MKSRTNLAEYSGLKKQLNTKNKGADKKGKTIFHLCLLPAILYLW